MIAPNPVGRPRIHVDPLIATAARQLIATGERNSHGLARLLGISHHTLKQILKEGH